MYKSPGWCYSSSMATPQSRLFKEALDLTEKDRAELAGLLIDSLDAEEGGRSRGSMDFRGGRSFGGIG